MPDIEILKGRVQEKNIPYGQSSAKLHVTLSLGHSVTGSLSPQSTEVFYLDHCETANGPIEKVYVTTLVTPMGLASSFNGGIFKIIVKKWANFENSINHHKNGLVWCM